MTADNERFCEVGEGITLCYETFGNPADPPLLLVMGLATQMIGWPDDFCRALAARGFHVVRFDNRDAGRSTHIAGAPPTIPQLVVRSRGAAHYTLEDMARDAAGLLRELDLAPAHVVGASMGGMIAQTLAAQHPDAVRSLVSIMSSTGSRWSGQPAPKMYSILLRPRARGREAAVERAVRVFSAIGSKGLEQDLDHVREVAGRAYDRDHDPAAPGRQLAAVLASGDRTAALRRIAAPTLVIHGKGDRLISPSGGKATARAIPGARTLFIEGMGHDLPRAAWRRIIDGIAETAERADPVPGRQVA
jgi:pimeloyl-ACP methyl ester carboxylesterase